MTLFGRFQKFTRTAVALAAAAAVGLLAGCAGASSATVTVTKTATVTAPGSSAPASPEATGTQCPGINCEQAASSAAPAECLYVNTDTNAGGSSSVYVLAADDPQGCP